MPACLREVRDKLAGTLAQHLLLEKVDAVLAQEPVTPAMRTTAPTAQDDNGVRIEAQDDDAVPVDRALQIADEAIDRVIDRNDHVLAALVEGLHAQIFGVHSLDDPALSHAALADGGVIHEAAHALLRSLPASRLSADHTAASPDVPRHE